MWLILDVFLKICRMSLGLFSIIRVITLIISFFPFLIEVFRHLRIVSKCVRERYIDIIHPLPKRG
jgi:hypothetical protein